MDRTESLHEILDTFFGDRRRFFLTFSESPDKPTLRELLMSDLNQSVREFDRKTQLRLCGGFFPILLVTYDFRFDRGLAGTEVIPYLAAIPDGQEMKFQYDLVYAPSRDGVRDAFRKALSVTQARSPTEQAAFRQHEDGADCVFPVQEGERMISVYFAAEPLPGERGQS